MHAETKRVYVYATTAGHPGERLPTGWTFSQRDRRLPGWDDWGWVDLPADAESWWVTAEPGCAPKESREAPRALRGYEQRGGTEQNEYRWAATDGTARKLTAWQAGRLVLGLTDAGPLSVRVCERGREGVWRATCNPVND